MVGKRTHPERNRVTSHRDPRSSANRGNRGRKFDTAAELLRSRQPKPDRAPAKKSNEDAPSNNLEQEPEVPMQQSLDKDHQQNPESESLPLALCADHDVDIPSPSHSSMMEISSDDIASPVDAEQASRPTATGPSNFLPIDITGMPGYKWKNNSCWLDSSLQLLFVVIMRDFATFSQRVSQSVPEKSAIDAFITHINSRRLLNEEFDPGRQKKQLHLTAATLVAAFLRCGCCDAALRLLCSC